MESETEVWQEEEEEFLDDIEAPEFIELDPAPVECSSHNLATWVLRFLMTMRVAFRLPDVVLDHFLKFFLVLFRILGCFCSNITVVKYLPSSMYKAIKLVELPYRKYVVCRKCCSLYKQAECIEGSGRNAKSRKCSFRKYPCHPQANMRSPYGGLLMKTIELSNQNVYHYPFLMYCYFDLEVALQGLFNRPDFYDRCDHWRRRPTIEESLCDVYDGRMWKAFSSFDGTPFLSEPGNLGLILNFDFFQPFEHLQYSVGVIYMSILNLPRDRRYKRENVILVGIIPGPHEPEKNINSFLKPLVSDLMKFWDGVELNVASYNCKKKVRCAVMCISCDLPAGRKMCGFLGHNARLGCSRCLKKFPGPFGSLDYSGFDRENWEMRSSEKHRADCNLILQQNTKKCY